MTKFASKYLALLRWLPIPLYIQKPKRLKIKYIILQALLLLQSVIDSKKTIFNAKMKHASKSFASKTPKDIALDRAGLQRILLLIGQVKIERKY